MFLGDTGWVGHLLALRQGHLRSSIWTQTHNNLIVYNGFPLGRTWTRHTLRHRPHHCIHDMHWLVVYSDSDTNGSFTCSCNNGYTGNGTACINIDECLTSSHNCDMRANCSDTNGSFTCSCNNGYTGNGTTCINIDECLTSSHNCDTRANCSDTNGSFVCLCNQTGYYLRAVGGLQCLDSDECAEASHNCSVFATVRLSKVKRYVTLRLLVRHVAAARASRCGCSWTVVIVVHVKI